MALHLQVQAPADSAPQTPAALAGHCSADVRVVQQQQPDAVQQQCAVKQPSIGAPSEVVDPTGDDDSTAAVKVQFEVMCGPQLSSGNDAAAAAVQGFTSEPFDSTYMQLPTAAYVSMP
jgi:hypothetical protein